MQSRSGSTNGVARQGSSTGATITMSHANNNKNTTCPGARKKRRIVGSISVSDGEEHAEEKEENEEDEDAQQEKEEK